MPNCYVLLFTQPPKRLAFSIRLFSVKLKLQEEYLQILSKFSASHNSPFQNGIQSCKNVIFALDGVHHTTTGILSPRIFKVSLLYKRHDQSNDHSMLSYHDSKDLKNMLNVKMQKTVENGKNNDELEKTSLLLVVLQNKAFLVTILDSLHRGIINLLSWP